MKIVVRAKQVIDNETRFDDILEFKSVKEFIKEIDETRDNWLNMMGSSAKIDMSDSIHVGVYIDMQCKGNNDREVWRIEDIFLT